MRIWPSPQLQNLTIIQVGVAQGLLRAQAQQWFSGGYISIVGSGRKENKETKGYKVVLRRIHPRRWIRTEGKERNQWIR
ncbi:hypothetical protein NDU88_000307 [Pleurodeles waltl]|uniref:Uncharacterized protein n=1 Tax=Pleurodeles waltl TaxID=8319 RepID=A0AAV7KLV9_PLEWA|nr:hypothetical protein NDU88_000307 [Pleurodeles waltl]